MSYLMHPENLFRCGWYSVSSLAIVKLTQPFILVRSWLRGRQLTASGSMPASVGWSLQMKSGFWMMISSQFSPQVRRLNPVVWYQCQRELMKDLPLFKRIVVLLVGSLHYRTKWCTPCARNFPMVKSSIVYWISKNLTQSPLMLECYRVLQSVN